ncbi:hypothetical protein GF312_16150 [Candidatus Poribacteria bacterium]|nr:hypothetical protein [Candidatus Poribacteria bacterium]
MSIYPQIVPVTQGTKHHFFGYYDKFPWDITGRYMLGLAVEFMDRPPEPDDTAEIGLIDREDENKWKTIAETHAWNWQQGTMLQWMPDAPDRLIIYNDRVGDVFISVIRDIHTGESKTLPLPIYALSRDGKFAVSVNFSRIHQMRQGYGYPGLPLPDEDELHPEYDGIYLLNLESGDYKLIISLAQIVEIRHKASMEGVKHWFNHLQFNHDSSRFLFLHRWRRQEGRGHWTRLFTANPDGSEIHCVADHDMVSHFDWQDNKHILAWATQHDIGDRYFVFTDGTDEKQIIGEGVLTTDGHCSYSPDGQWILTDTYPDREHKRTLILYRLADGKRIDIGRFYAPPKLRGEIRCDLHPRWSRDGQQVCIDSAHENHRHMYVLDVSHIV